MAVHSPLPAKITRFKYGNLFMRKVIPIAKSPSRLQRLMTDEDLQYMRLQTDCQAVFFVSSAGHCTFDCEYCIVNPIAKKEASLDYSDFQFFLGKFSEKVFLIFSGKGDFFASYPKSARLLDKILDHLVEIALDINGAIIQEFPQLTTEKLAKIRYINLTMHYQQIQQKNLLARWAEHARLIIDKKGQDLLMGYILSPKLSEEWQSALNYYSQQVFAKTGKQIVLVKDVNQTFSAEQEKLFQQLQTDFADCVAGIHDNNFSKIFFNNSKVLCPAGHRYFRIWNDGRVQACPYIPTLTDAGNVKQRQIKINPSAYPCATPEFCDCHVIEGLGKMNYQQKDNQMV